MAEAQPVMSGGTAAVAGGDRRLRVALVWNGAVQSEATLPVPAPIVIGPTLSAGFIVPEAALENDLTLLEPAGAGYRLNMLAGLGGAIWLGGVRTDVSTLSTGPIPLGPDDY